MIIDSMENINIYAGIHRYFDKILDYLKKTDMSDLSIGRHEISKDIFLILNKYATITEEETFIECHRKYIDIQIMVKGSERMGICHKNACLELEYNDKEDYQKLEGKLDFITVRENHFTVFFPHDGHMPQLMIGEKPEEVRKIVIKVPV